MNDLKGQPAEMRATVTIKRASTGKVETYNLTGRVAPEQAEQIVANKTKEQDHGSNA